MIVTVTRAWLVLALLVLAASAAAREVRLDLVLSPVGGGRDDATVLALEPMVNGWIMAVIRPAGLTPVHPRPGPRREPEADREGGAGGDRWRPPPRWRIDCGVVEDERPERVTLCTVRVYDTHSNRRPLVPVWSGNIERLGGIEQVGSDLTALLEAAVAVLPPPVSE